jgi:hypothetical protein
MIREYMTEYLNFIKSKKSEFESKDGTHFTYILFMSNALVSRLEKMFMGWAPWK